MFERTYNSHVLTYDEDLYTHIYTRTLPDGRVLHYGRELLNMGDPPHWVTQARLLSRFGLRPSDSILIVGCGFSPLVTYGRNSYGTDPSSYIQEHKNEEADAPDRILPYPVPDPHLTELASRLNFRWVISDDVLSSLDGDCIIGRPGESEAERFVDGCSQLGHHVIHFVTTGPADADWGSPLFTYKPLEEWAAYEPSHIWIDAGTYEVIFDG